MRKNSSKKIQDIKMKKPYILEFFPFRRAIISLDFPEVVGRIKGILLLLLLSSSSSSSSLPSSPSSSSSSSLSSSSPPPPSPSSSYFKD
jgi:hypothetical protein